MEKITTEDFRQMVKDGECVEITIDGNGKHIDIKDFNELKDFMTNFELKTGIKGTITRFFVIDPKEDTWTMYN